MTKQIVISLLSGLLILFCVLNLPVNFDYQTSNINDENFGVSYTELDGSIHKVSDIPTLVNNALSALNSGKIETSTTSLPLVTTMSGLTSASNLATVGAITSGTWNGSTLSVAYGGTGSTTLLTNGVLYGNGTNGIKAVPVGSEDQVLTLVSGVPQWTSTAVDESANYSWTGVHNFSSSATYNGAANFNNTVLGASPFFYDTGVDGTVTLTSSTTLTSDKNYLNLTINDGVVLNPGGYRIYVKGTLTFVGNGKIACNGGNGGNGGNGVATGPTAGSAGTAGAIAYTTDNTFLPYPLAGKAGLIGVAVNNNDSAGNGGTAGDARDKALNINASGDGGAGGRGYNSHSAAGGGANGAITYTNKGIKTALDTTSFIDEADNTISILYPTTGSGSGGSGGVVGIDLNDKAASGGSGGSGASGCYILIYARYVVTVNGNDYIQSIGGNGGNGGNGDVVVTTTASGAGGGGGGAGGAGGVVILVYQVKTGTGTIDVSGGIGGTGGTGEKGGAAFGQLDESGANGGNGADGSTYLFNL